MYKEIPPIDQSINRYFESKIERITNFCETSDLPAGIGVYLSRKTERLRNAGPINHNCKYYFENNGQPIVCRHISHAFLQGYIGTKENNYEQIKEKENFIKKLNEMGNNYDREIGMKIAKKNYICSLDQIGEVLHVIAANMLESDRLEEAYFIYSERHAMALRFIRKDNVIKIDFYDPNDTCSHKNIIFKDLNCLKNIHFKHLVSHDDLERYFSISPFMYVASLNHCDKEQNPQLSILADVNADNLSVAIMYYSLSMGVFHTIENPAGIFTVLKSIENFLPAEQDKDNMAINLLHAQHSYGIPGLFMALQFGHEKTVMAFVSLILNSNLPDPDKYNLLQARHPDSTTGLFAALAYGHQENVAVFTRLILESNLLALFKYNLLLAMRGDGAPGLFIALNNGHQKTVKTFVRLIIKSNLSDKDKYNLLQARYGGGPSGFFMALQQGHKGTVAIFTRLILESNLPDLLKYNLLQALGGDGTRGLFMALKNGHKETVTVFTGLVLQSNLSTLPKYDLLLARRGGGPSGFFMALRNGHQGTVAIFTRLVMQSNLPDLLKYNLLRLTLRWHF